MWLSVIFKWKNPMQGSERVSRQGASLLPPLFQWPLAGLHASKIFLTAIPDYSLKHTSFTMLLCCSTTYKDTELTHGKPSQGPRFCSWRRVETLTMVPGIQALTLGQVGHMTEGRPDGFLLWESLLALGNLNPKVSRHQASSFPSSGWIKKNQHQDLGESLAGNVRTACGNKWAILNSPEKAKIQNLSIWANNFDLSINWLVHSAM